MTEQLPEPAPDTTRRLFVAVMLPPEVQTELVTLSRPLDAYRDIMRLVRPEALHFTLQFLGNRTAEEESSAAGACAVAAAAVGTFALSIGGLGCFPNERRPRVIWLGVREGAEPLVTLQRRLADELLRRGLIHEREDFTPHLTLARVRSEAVPAARAALGASTKILHDGGSVHYAVTSVSLVRSVLTPRGSQYTILNRWPLRNGTAAQASEST